MHREAWEGSLRKLGLEREIGAAETSCFRSPRAALLLSLRERARKMDSLCVGPKEVCL
jgi:hypothetical protein